MSTSSTYRQRPSRAPSRTTAAPAVLAAIVLALAGCAAGESAATDDGGGAVDAPSTTQPVAPTTTGPLVMPASGPIEPGTYRFASSPWSAMDFSVTIPQGWAVQYGHYYSKHENESGEVSLYAISPDAIFTDACTGEGVSQPVGPQPEDLVDALVAQPGAQVSDPVQTTLGGYPAWRLELTVPQDLDLATCRIGENGLQVWHNAAADKYLVILPDGTVNVYVVDVDGQRQVFVTQHRDATLDSDRAELDAMLESIQIHP
jgi:hypothetical protein